MKKNILALLFITAFLMSSNASKAIIGQTEAQFKTWAQANPLVKGAKFELIEDTYEYTKKISGTNITFVADIDNYTKKVYQETIAVQELFSDKKMVSVVEKIWGKAVLKELMSSKIVYNKKLPYADGQSTLLLKGPKYGFVVDKFSSDMKAFTILMVKPTEIQKVYNEIAQKAH